MEIWKQTMKLSLYSSFRKYLDEQRSHSCRAEGRMLIVGGGGLRLKSTSSCARLICFLIFFDSVVKKSTSHCTDLWIDGAELLDQLAHYMIINKYTSATFIGQRMIENNPTSQRRIFSNKIVRKFSTNRKVSTYYLYWNILCRDCSK